MPNKSVLRGALGLRNAVVEGVRREGGAVVFSVRPKARVARRCPHRGRRCAAHDRIGRRRWKALDLGEARCLVEAGVVRVSCLEHGVIAERVPWARHRSAFTRAFEDQVTWLACHCCMSVVATLMHVDWHTVGPICRRIEAELEAGRGRSRLEGIRAIGVDETSYKRGHKYTTVVVDHDTGAVVWARKGHGKAVLREFFALLTEGQGAAVEVVTADGTRWIKEVVGETPRSPASTGRSRGWGSRGAGEPAGADTAGRRPAYRRTPTDSTATHTGRGTPCHQA